MNTGTRSTNITPVLVEEIGPMSGAAPRVDDLT